MKAYLIAVSIGPVQDFIAAARKLRDLWFGSYLLSEISKKGAWYLQNQGAQLIFPYTEHPEIDLIPGSLLKAPNKILAYMETDNPGQLVQKTKKSILEFWKNELALKTIKNYQYKDINQELFDLQVNDFLEIYGAWTPLADKTYAQARERVEAILAARKTLRECNQCDAWPEGQGGLPKSSLDGIRESILNAQGRKKHQGLKEEEELDALGWIKRHGEKIDSDYDNRPEFESLSDLAADSFLRGAVQNKKALALLSKLPNLLTSAGIILPRVADRTYRQCLQCMSPQILFRSRLDQIFDEQQHEIPNQDRQAVRSGLQALFKATNNTEPFPYAAVLVGDGDNMGACLAKFKTRAKHCQFSMALDRFARDCENLVKSHHGGLVYSGGDDVLAFAPLDTALECSEKLRLHFQKHMAPLFEGTDEQPPTFSIGMAIVHHLKPMGSSLDLARKAEKIAKAYPGKNAIALILDKRGGAPVELCAGWDCNIINTLKRWIECYVHDLIPYKIGYELRTLAEKIGSPLQWHENMPDNAATYEFLRVLKRKKSGHGQNELAMQEIDTIIQAASQTNNLDDLAKQLVIAKTIATSVILGQGASHHEKP
ncbi:MAG: type III-B CRISPR-associated protein Cas10/Cmr2 [Desulfoplanes sp.]